jgi:hypothetical protein
LLGAGSPMTPTTDALFVGKSSRPNMHYGVFLSEAKKSNDRSHSG